MKVFMATIVNNPPAADSSANGVGLIMGILILAIVVAALFYWGVPMTRQNSGPTINVPDTVDVNVNQPDNPTQ
jgi:hypothetical protein